MAKKNFENKVTVLEGSLKKLSVQLERGLKSGKSLAEMNEQLTSSIDKLSAEYEDALKVFQSKLTVAVKAEDVAKIDTLKKQINSLTSTYKETERAIENVRKAGQLQAKENTKNIPSQRDAIDSYNQAQKASTTVVKENLQIVKKRFIDEGKLIKFQTLEAKKARKVDEDLKVQQIKSNGKSLEEQKKQLSNYFSGRLRNLTKFGLKDSSEYKKIQERRLKTEKEFNDKIESERRKLEGKSFKGGFFAQFTPAKIGATLGGLTKLLGGYRIYRVALQGLTSITVGSAKAAIQFQAELGNLAAVAGRSTEEVDRLGDVAIEVANATTFTASEIIKLQIELSRLGFSIDEIVDSTAAIAQTAQALGEDVGGVAKKVGQVLKQFNISAKETNLVTDTMVSTINNSALSFEGFGTAIQYVGPLAAELGTTFYQTSAAMAVLADNGFTASRVGTGLRGILTELGTEGQDLESILIELADAEISFAQAVDLVGKRNAAQLITLVDNLDALDETESKYYQAGSALLASSRQVSTFDGNMKLLNSAWDAFQIKLGTFVAESGIVKTALKLLSEESYNTAVALGVISGVDVAKLGDSIDQGVAQYEKLRSEGIGAQEAISQSAAATAEQLLDSTTLGIRYRNYEYALSVTAEAKKEALVLANTKLVEEYNAALNGTTTILENQIQANARLEVAEDARALITDKNQPIFDRMLENKRDENLTAEGAIKHNKELIAEIESLRATKNAQQTDEIKGLLAIQKEGGALTEAQKQQLIAYEATVNQLDVFISKMLNLKISDEEIAKIRTKSQKETDNAQKEELARLREIIRQRKDELKRKKESLEFEARLAELNGDSERAAQIRNEYLTEQGEIYHELNDLVTENTILNEENKDALGRMFSELNVDDKELLAAFNSLLKTYKTSTKNLENLTEEQKQEIVGNFITDLKKTIPQIKDFSDEQLKQLNGAVYKSIFSTDDDATKNATNKQIRDILSQAKDALVDGLNFFNDVAFDNLKSRLDAEKEALKERYEFESGILKSKLDNDIISESQYRAKQEKLRKDQVDAENAIEKKLFDAEKKRDANKAKIDYVEAVASIFINEIKEGKGVLSAAAMQAIGTGIATARFGAEIASISARQFVPKKYESGGLVSGPSHANGGVPFRVQGRGGYEMEGGEFIVNKRATAMHYDLLNSINGKYANSSYTPARMFKNGGIVNSLEQRQEELNLLRAIAESSVNTSKNTSKPARAYITNSDIRSNETERTITNRNTRL